VKRIATSSIVLALLAASAFAVTPATWDFAAEADFAEGEFHSTVASSLGGILLSRQVEVILPADEAPAVVTCVALADNVAYVGGSDNVVRMIRDGKMTKMAELPCTMVGTLVWTGTELVAGACGDEAGVYIVGANNKSRKIWSNPSVKYIWGMAVDRNGIVYVATGPEAAVYQIRPDGKSELLYQAKDLANNILCLALGAEGKLYAGTDEKGLVVEIDIVKRKGRVLLETQEKEVSAVVPDGQGGVYAATSDSSRAGEEETPPQTEAVGKSEKHKARAESQSEPQEPEGSESASDAHEKESTSADAENGHAPTTRPAGEKEGKPAPQPKVKPAPSAEEGQGNAVYHIHPNGLVTTVFRKPVSIFAMIMVDGELLLGTGNSGQLFRVAVESDEVSQLANTDAEQVTCLASGRDGHVVFGTSGKGCVASLGRGYAPQGTYISPVKDAEQIAQWGTMRVTAKVPDGAKLSLATRSGNVSEPDEQTWSEWSREQEVTASAPASGAVLNIESPSARFLQYRLTLSRKDSAMPAVKQAQIVYQVGNLAPEISAVTVQPSDKGKDGGGESQGNPQYYRDIAVTATDPNQDELEYRIAFREAGTTEWITLVKDLKETSHVWDTRGTGDGVYELRVTASDSPSNPPATALKATRVSEIFVVDNTPPAMKDLSTSLKDGACVVKGQAADALSRLTSLAYSVDSQEEWTAVLPVSGICDSASASFEFTVKNLKPGAHRIAVRAKDQFDNTGYGTVTVMVEK
jgi:sugar lactone lactonase YvrE